MAREKEDIPAEESLFRRVREEHLDGSTLLEAAIDVPGCSVNREAYSQPADVFTPAAPDLNRVARVQCGDMPEPVQRDDGMLMFWRPEDDPIEDNEAHAEVRLVRQPPNGDPFYKKNWKGGARVEELKSLLAERFTVMDQPRYEAPG